MVVFSRHIPSRKRVLADFSALQRSEIAVDLCYIMGCKTKDNFVRGRVEGWCQIFTCNLKPVLE